MRGSTFCLLLSLFVGTVVARPSSQSCMDAKQEVARLDAIIKKGGLHPYHAMQADDDLRTEQEKLKLLCNPTVHIPKRIVQPIANTGPAHSWGSSLYDEDISAPFNNGGCVEAKIELEKTEDAFQQALARGSLLSYHIDEAETEIKNLKARVQQECEGKPVLSSPSKPAPVPAKAPVSSTYGSGSARPWGSALHDYDDYDVTVTSIKRGGCHEARKELAQTEAAYQRQQGSMLSYQIEEAEDDIRRLKARVESECGSRQRLAEILVKKFKRFLINLHPRSGF